MTYSSYELKYCERCGGLGLRRNKSGLPYCRDCEHMLHNFLTRRPADTAPGQLRRIVHRPTSSTNPLIAEEAVHAS